MERSAKRQRVSGLMTPSLSPGEVVQQDGDRSTPLNRAVDILRVEAQALTKISDLYQDNEKARMGLEAAVGAILRAQRTGGKLVVCAVGKSAYIGMKLTATAKSLSISASFLHGCEAVHGDLGDVKTQDVLVFVSFSGKTPELLNILPHLPAQLTIIAITSHTNSKDCPLLSQREGGILLPAPIHESEESTFGVKAPTTSTTVALAIADMIALTVADQLHNQTEKTKDIFYRNHPGGAIGISHRQVQQLEAQSIDDSVNELPSPSVSAKSDDQFEANRITLS